MREKLTVLLIEDNPGDARLIREFLAMSGGSFHVEVADRLATGLARLEAQTMDAILLDLSLPDSSGFDTFARLHAQAPRVPIIVMTGLDDEALAEETVRAGAQDYLVKGQVDGNLLTRSIRYAVERKQAETALAQERLLLRTVIDNLPDAIFAKDLHGRRMLANRADLNSIGKPEAEVLGKTAAELFPPHVAIHFEADDDTVLQTGQPVLDREEFLVNAEGRQIWRLTSKVPLRDAAGQVVGLVGIGRDITERKRVEEALRESEERFRSLYENATIGLYRTTPDGQILMANSTLVRIVGYPSFEELAQRNLEETGFEPDYPRQFFLQRIESEGAIIGLESAWKRKDGSSIYVRESARAIRDAEGRTLYYDGTVEDITERKRAEKALRESEQRLRRFYESGLVGVIYWNMRGQITDANDKFLEMVGYTRDELVAGQIDWVNMTPPEYRHLDDASVAELTATGVNRTPYEKEYIRKDGTRIPILIAGAMLDEARFNGVAFVLDITERKQAGAQLADQLDELRRWQAVTLGRETRILDLKREVNELLARAGQPPRYPSAEIAQHPIGMEN